MKKQRIISLLVLLVLLVAGSFTIYSSNLEGAQASAIPARDKTPLELPVGDKFEKEWHVIDSLVTLGLTRQVLEDLDEIYNRAIQQSYAPQAAKALLYKINVQANIEEEAYVKTIADLEGAAENAFFPLKPLLHSVTAMAYWSYYNRNRWRIQQRTTTVDFKQDDIRTWDLQKIVAATVRQHQLALASNPEKTQRVPVEYFDAILYERTEEAIAESRNLRPTLYDLLAHRAIDFFQRAEPNVTRPAYKFIVEDTNLFADAAAFAQLELSTRDTMSMDFQALLVLQELLRFHLDDADPRALIDADLKRLKFVHGKSVSEDKAIRYMRALEQMLAKHTAHESSAEIMHQLAVQLNTQAGKYKRLESDDFRWDKKKAVALCEQAIQKYPSSYGAKHCETLLNQIKEKSLRVIGDRAAPPNAPSRKLLHYQNIDSLYFRVVAVNFDTYFEKYGSQGQDQVASYLVGLEAVKNWKIGVDDEGDYQSHAVDMKIPALPIGHYMILASANRNFTLAGNAVSYSEYWSTNLAYTNRRLPDGKYEVMVLDRTSGSPIEGATVSVYTQKYNYRSRKYNNQPIGEFTTDKEGRIFVPFARNRSGFGFTVKKDNDRISSESHHYQYGPQKAPEPRVRTHFFTDRAIYRPGQNIHFKGIVMDVLGTKHTIKTNYSTQVVFTDVNGQEVGALDLKSNEYGSINGTFIAPQGGLLGNMSISNGHGYHSVSVEEYKRPKFEVTFQPMKGTYRLADKVTVNGLAKAYAGSNIDGAAVKYRVVRSASFPRWYYYRSFYPTSPEMEITNGETITDENGAFEVAFTAIPDRSIVSSSKPTFNYTVYADVVDINGETHSSQTQVRVGYTALELSVNVPGQVDKSGKNKFKVETSNLAGEPEPAAGKVTVYKLQQPTRTFRKRKMERADQYLYDRETFYKHFPKDLYDDENNKYTWKREEKVLETTFDTKSSDELTFTDMAKWELGHYVLEATTEDRYGEPVKALVYFLVNDPKSKRMEDNTIAFYSFPKKAFEPGEKAELTIGTAEKNVQVLYELEHDNKIVHREWIELSNEKRTVSVGIEEKHRGNLVASFLFVKDSRYYQRSHSITVPHSNKKLDIAFETFRSKLYPGQEEEWKIKIKGHKGEKVAAEMVASLYDVSLDAFRANNWNFNALSNYSQRIRWEKGSSFDGRPGTLYSRNWNETKYHPVRSYDQLNWFNNYRYLALSNRQKSMSILGGEADAMPMEMQQDGIADDEVYTEDLETGGSLEVLSGFMMSDKKAKEEEGTYTVKVTDKNGNAQTDLSAVKARSNFNETAFFFPVMETNAEGDVVLKFTMPESLTRWKFMGFAHTKELAYGQLLEDVVTQKELMVQPNAPRFFREGDKINLVAKISNLSEKELSGDAQLFLFDAVSMKPIDTQFRPGQAVRKFTVKAGQSTAVDWPVFVPDNVQAITYRIVAKAGSFSDGEEAALPVLSNRMLVTESMPMPIRGQESKTFKFEKLLASGNSTTLKHHKYTLEFTSNPAWYAVQALPYLMEYPYECSEQIFSRFYANSMASHIANSSPAIQRVFESWKRDSPGSLLSNLEKNQELKSLMLQETPWVMDARNESERKKRVALLFDLNKMTSELDRALTQLEKAQTPNGGWAWFPGMRDNSYITQHIVAGMGHLDNLGIKRIKEDKRVQAMIKKAVPYLDDRMREQYEELKRRKVKLAEYHLGHSQIQYLYARSYFRDIPVGKKNKEAFEFYQGQAEKFWLENSYYMQGMIALALHRFEKPKVPQLIINSLKENAIFSEEMGMYWKNSYGYYWYQAPIETQALLIETFDEVGNDQKSMEEMKIWLLKQKQTQDWKTTKATAEACYALLLRGTDWLAETQLVEVTVGDQVVDPSKMPEVKVEAGTGYFKTSWAGSEIKPGMGTVKVNKKDKGVAWGAMYWQYFEQLDKITPAETPLKLQKQLFLERPSDKGPVITPVTAETKLKPGDKLKVRIELRVDRAMEYVHMKDMRASGFEPVNVLSTYKYQDGLGYYESTGDAATNFFFDYLPKGTYVFEYPLKVYHEGDFSNGITSIQCMYAPEFASHSEGIRVQVGK